MSYVKLENRPASWWRCRAATIGQMIGSGWTVWSVSNNCFLVMPADLDWFAYKLGDGETYGTATRDAGGWAAWVSSPSTGRRPRRTLPGPEGRLAQGVVRREAASHPPSSIARG